MGLLNASLCLILQLSGGIGYLNEEAGSRASDHCCGGAAPERVVMRNSGAEGFLRVKQATAPVPCSAASKLP